MNSLPEDQEQAFFYVYFP